jgi:hypothetical protein
MMTLRCDSYEQVMWSDLHQDRHGDHERQDERADDSEHFGTTHIEEKQNEHGDEKDSSADRRSNDPCRYIKARSRIVMNSCVARATSLSITLE